MMKTDNNHPEQNNPPATPPGKVFDVLHPSKVAPSPTSKPVIVGHKPQVKDQVIGGTPEPFAASPFEKHELMDGAKRMKIQPATAPEVNEMAEPATPIAQSPPEPLAPAPSATKEAQRESPISTTAAVQSSTAMPKEDSVDLDPRASLEQLAVNQVIEEPPEGANQNGIPVDELQATQSNPAKQPLPPLDDDMLGAMAPPLLDDKMIVSHHRRRMGVLGWLVAILLIIVLALTILNFLLDAEIIHLNIDVPHTDLLTGQDY